MKYKIFVKLTLLALSSLANLCTGAVSPALPLIQKDLELNGATDVGLIVKMMVVIPNVFIAIFSPIFGCFANKIGRLKLLFIAMLLYSISGTAGVYLPTIQHILLSRVVLGICIAAILTVVTSLIADYFDGPERSSLIGMQTMFMSIGSTLYGFIAGVLADISWRNIFWLYGISIIYFPFAVKFLFNPNSSDNNDIGIKTSEKVVQNNLAVMLICCVNLFVMVMFYMIKLQLPYMLYNDAAINYVNIPNFNGFHITGFTRVAINAKLVAICLSCEVIVTTFVAYKYRRFKANRDFSVMCAMGFIFMGFSYLMITHSVNYWMILFSMCICGAGMGMLMPNSTLWIISITKPENRPLFIGIFNTSTYAGKFLSPFIAAPLLWLIPKNPRMLFEICAFMMLCIAILAMWANDRFKRINRIMYRRERQQKKMLEKEANQNLNG